MTNKGTLATLEVDDWDGSLRTVINDMGGAPLNVHKLLANQPGLLRAWWAFRNYVVSGGALGLRNAEIVILRTAVHVGAAYEWHSHVVRARAAGLSMHEIDRVRQGAKAGWDDADALLIRCVDELVESCQLGQASLDEFANAFGRTAALDLIAIHSSYLMLGMVLNTWPVELDEDIASQLAELKKAPT